MRPPPRTPVAILGIPKEAGTAQPPLRKKQRARRGASAPRGSTRPPRRHRSGTRPWSPCRLLGCDTLMLLLPPRDTRILFLRCCSRETSTRPASRNMRAPLAHRERQRLLQHRDPRRPPRPHPPRETRRRTLLPPPRAACAPPRTGNRRARGGAGRRRGGGTVITCLPPRPRRARARGISRSLTLASGTAPR